MTTPLPKRFGYKLPLEALGGACVRVSLEFPDKLEYRAAFNGAINMLGKWFQWDHTQADYQDIPELNVEVAQVWSEVLADALWEACMTFCEQMIANAECFLDDASVQTEIINHLLSNQTFVQAMNQIASKGVPMPETELPTPVVSGCDPDQAWAAIDAVVEQMNVNNLDFFQLFEGMTNKIERSTTLLSLMPALKGINFSTFTEFVDQLFDNIYEGYEAAITTELLNEYKCDLFCLGMADPECELGFDAIYNYFKDRVGGTFTIESALQVVIEFLATGSFSSTLIADFMYMLQIQIIRSASNFLGVNVISLQVVAQTGALVPSSAWELLCPECAPEWEHTWDLTTSAYDWSLVGTFVNGVGIQSTGTGGSPYTAQVYRTITWPSGSALTRVLVGATSTTADGGAFRGVYWPGSANPPQTGYTSNTGDYEMDFTPNNDQPGEMAIQVSNNTVPGTNTIRYVTLRGTGTEPTW